jgi:hypothetical protein
MEKFMFRTKFICIAANAIALMMILTSGMAAQESQPLYKDPVQPVDKRVDDLVGAGNYSITIGEGQPNTQASRITAKFEIQGERQLPR